MLTACGIALAARAFVAIELDQKNMAALHTACETVSAGGDYDEQGLTIIETWQAERLRPTASAALGTCRVRGRLRPSTRLMNPSAGAGTLWGRWQAAVRVPSPSHRCPIDACPPRLPIGPPWCRPAARRSS